ncbi:MAG: sensor histidine kinase [Saprospiraceae bacterium]|nr:sensor histidine kinase [Saprospiraceae bacterium]
MRILSIGVIIYILAAVTWWSFLLVKKNREAFDAKERYYRQDMQMKGLAGSEAEFFESETYLRLQKTHRRQQLMIIGEGTVFVLSLLLGIWFVNRAYLQEAASARQRRNFLLSITHELKSPIAGIQLAVETLLKRELLREQSEKLLGNALRETGRLNILVNDLLLSAKLETAYRPHIEPLDISAMMEEIVREFQAKYPNATFQLSCSDDLPPFAGDRSGLSAVGYNLLENAAKYSPEPAWVAMSIQARDNNGIRLEVADRGVGIPEKERRRIFDKFYRIGNEDTRQTKGTGLGLYIVEQIVLAHQGTIAVLDNSPAGAIFRIDLPFLKP